MEHTYILNAHPFGGEPFSQVKYLEALLRSMASATHRPETSRPTPLEFEVTDLSTADGGEHFHVISDNQDLPHA